MVGVVTSSFVASNWCSAEVGIAGALGCRLTPVRAEAGVGAPADAAPPVRGLPGRPPASPRPGAAGGAAAG
ncbi:MAG: hypothetical protein ACRDRU_08325 [Pseudonocardiaceae bacterium]